MTATFGKLRGAHMELGPGLNILQAPNEGGKSTWCAFLRAMLYGIDTRDRDRKGYLADKNRYQPWEGGAMEGSVDLEWGGRAITLRRGPKGNVPFGAFSAVYTGTEEPVPGLTGENCGETLLGISRSVFERSAFVGQGGAAIGESAELERRIAALVSSGEEDVSYSQVESRLKDWRNRRRYNKSGAIPRLEGELEVLNDTLARQERARCQAREAAGALEELTARRELLREKLRAWRSQENVEKRRRWQEAQEALAAAQAEVEELKAAVGETPEREVLRSAQGDLAYLNTLETNQRRAENQAPAARAAAGEARRAAEDPLFAGQTPDRAWEQAIRDKERAASAPKKAPVWLAVAGGLSLLTAGGLCVAGAFLEQKLFFLAAGICFALGGACLVARNCVARGRAKRHGAEVAALLEQYGAETPEDILTRAGAYREKWSRAEEAERQAAALEESAAELAAQRDEQRAALLELVHPFAPEVRDVFGISAALSRALGLAEKLSNAQVRLEGARALAEGLERPEESDGPSGGAGVAEAELDARELADEIAGLESEIARQNNALSMARGELNTLGDPDLFEVRRQELTEELTRRREEYDALTLALEGLDAANAALQARFSPALNEAAGRILAELTGGKYDRMTLTREFEASAGEAGQVLPRRALSVSQGTAEQLYLAARLAICELVLPEEETAPLVLDDALDAFDDARMALALNYLHTAAAKRQVLLFTCHNREGAWAAPLEDVRVESLQS